MGETANNFSERFIAAFKWILIAEGGEVNDPDDRGGHTKYGITKKAYPNIDITRVTKQFAMEIYHRDYWLRAGCDQLPAPLDICLFDAAVNHGAARAMRLLQEDIGYGVRPDGQIGPRTMAGIARHKPEDLVAIFLACRAEFYLRIVRNDPSQEKFLTGWLRRLFRLTMFLRGLQKC